MDIWLIGDDPVPRVLTGKGWKAWPWDEGGWPTRGEHVEECG